MTAAAPLRLLSVAICTRDRAGSLRGTLASLAGASVPPDCRVELLVIDNGSTDGTSTVVADFQPPHLTVRSLLEPAPGVAHARNRALQEAAGEIVLFIDDDVRLPPGWLEGMCRPLLDGTADVVQGGVRPAPHLERPWLKGALRTWLAAVEDPVHPPAGIVSANFAVRRRTADLAPGFDPRLGPGAAGFFEDTVFGWQLLRAGATLAYRPEVAVEHHFNPARLRLGAYLQTARRMAVSHAIVIRDGDDRLPVNTPGALLAQVPGLLARGLTQLVRFAWRRTPDAGFLVRYYRFCLWFALRRGRPRRT